MWATTTAAAVLQERRRTVSKPSSQLLRLSDHQLPLRLVEDVGTKVKVTVERTASFDLVLFLFFLLFLFLFFFFLLFTFLLFFLFFL